MTSQVLAVFYLNDMDHFIKNELHIKGVIRYQDDFLLFHESKEYLKYCLEQLTIFLKKEDLRLNKKTILKKVNKNIDNNIFKSTDNFIFIGRNKYGNYAKYRTVKRRLKKKMYLYSIGKLSLNSVVASRICYKNLCNNKLKI